MIMDAGEPRISRPGFDRQPALIQIKQIPDTPSFYRMEGRFHGLAYGSRRLALRQRSGESHGRA
jgi:hypothetical protein